MYGELSWLWPLLSPPATYASEARALRRHFARLERCVARGARPRLLDLGAGGGHVLVHLARHFDCTAVDCSAPMLEHCAELVPSARQIRADLRALRLGERFDCVLLHDAADYLLDADDVRAALDTAAAHLEPGGVLLVAPTYTREDFDTGEVAQDGVSGERVQVHYTSLVHAPDPSGARYELVLAYVIHDRQQHEVRVVEDRHQCGLFRRAEWLAQMRRAGFTATRPSGEAQPWTLFCGVKRGRRAAKASRPASGTTRRSGARRAG